MPSSARRQLLALGEARRQALAFALFLHLAVAFVLFVLVVLVLGITTAPVVVFDGPPLDLADHAGHDLVTGDDAGAAEHLIMGRSGQREVKKSG